MNINNLKSIAFCTVAFLAGMVAVGTVNAQPAQQQGGAPQTRVAPVVAPPGVGTPRLGFMGQMIHGYGMRVISANYGSPAQLAGLESGDVIFWIGGIRILSQFDYNQALQNAAMYNGGYVNMTVRNIRFDMGLSYQKFVNVTAYMPGYGMPVGGGGPVIAYGAQGGQSSMAMRSGNGQQGQAQQGQAQQGQAQMQARKGGEPRKKIKELKPSEVPRMKKSDQGTSQ